VLSTAQHNYLSIAGRGVQRTSLWRNPSQHWYNARLGDRARFPLATIWDATPLFEAVDGIAIADPTAANRGRVTRFADYAERYWDRHLRPTPGYAPYPGDRASNVETWFDDNGWWGLAFMDAYRATAKRRYLSDAARAFRFIASQGWDSSGGGIWWNTDHPWRSGEALGAATDLAARLYAVTRNRSYLAAAETFTAWANANLLNGLGFYSRRLPGVVPMPHDAQGAMIDAFSTLCAATGEDSWCARAEQLAADTVRWFLPLTNGPQYDSIYLRGLLSLYALDHQARWYDVASNSAAQILARARNRSGLFLLGWNGTSAIPDAVSGMLRTDAASVSVFAWLAVAQPPG
jgi:uncharacterized protein YyaL (SSP411 family)